MKEYNKIGLNYNINRSPDERILNRLIELLNTDSNSQICDIGAGTGNYTNEIANKGFIVDAFEPSEQMIKQAVPNGKVTWHQLGAEQITDTNKYDGAISTLAIHHFTDIDKSLSNISNCLKSNGNFVLFCADPREIDNDCWFKSYFAEIIQKAKSSYVPLDELTKKIKQEFGKAPAVEAFHIPHDITDGFFYAGWRTPEKYVDESFRKSISVFAKAPQNLIEKAVSKLKKDLDSGEWDSNFGHVRKATTYNGGYYFLKVEKS
ncbi:MAG: SAM-dependent methyltransferase [Glaciecola sp.]|jgi:SAM-dependent methyltransferase